MATVHMGDGRAVVLPSLLLCRFCFKKARSLPLRITCILKNLPAQEQNAKKYILLKAGISFRKVGMVGFAFVVSSNDRPPGHEGPWGTNNGSFHRPGSALAGTDWGGGSHLQAQGYACAWLCAMAMRTTCLQAMLC